MSYSSFTAEKLKDQFGVEQIWEKDIFASVETLLPSEILREAIDYNVNFAIMQGSEKARSEFIIAPILLEVKKKSNGKVSLFSGVKFDVDKSKKLDGISDFLISRSSYQVVLEAPVVVAVEAKRQDFEKGIAQCAAEMYGATLFNEIEGKDIPFIYGCATDGIEWKFLKLENKTYTLDNKIYTDLKEILGVWHYIIELFLV